MTSEEAGWEIANRALTGLKTMKDVINAAVDGLMSAEPNPKSPLPQRYELALAREAVMAKTMDLIESEIDSIRDDANITIQRLEGNTGK